jgi:anti-anti-sigma factor
MPFNALLQTRETESTIKLEGDLDSNSVGLFRQRLDEVGREDVSRLILDLTDLRYMSSAGLRGLVFARQKMGRDVEIVVVGANESVEETIRLTGFDRSIVMHAGTDGH